MKMEEFRSFGAGLIGVPFSLLGMFFSLSDFTLVYLQFVNGCLFVELKFMEICKCTVTLISLVADLIKFSIN